MLGYNVSGYTLRYCGNFGGVMKKYIELSIYCEKINKEDYIRLFNNLISRRSPFLGLINFSNILTITGINFIIKRQDKTIRLFVENKKGMYIQSPLIFPFKMSEPRKVEFMKNTLLPHGLYIIPKGNMLDFMVKENVEEIRIKINKFFGRFYAFGSAIDENGNKKILLLFDPAKFFEVDLEKNPTFYIELLDPPPKRINVRSNEPIFEYEGTSIGVDNFDVFQHSLVVGTSGSGKSKALEIMIKAVKKRYKDANILVIDPHNEFSDIFKDAKIVDFKNNYVEPLSTDKEKTPLQTQLIAQLITSTIGQENKYAERVVFYSVHLLADINELSLENLNLLLTDSTKRAEFTSMCNNPEVKRFFDVEFQDIYMQHFNDSILPVVNFIGEYMLYLGGEKKLENLEDLLDKNRITVVSFNPHFFGRKIIQFFAGSIINQMYILAINNKLKRPTILVVDEFPVVQTSVVKNILAETRKFNLYLYVSVQYLGQLREDVLESVMSNVRNVIAFKVTREDAKLLSSMMKIKVEEYFKKRMTPSELEEAKHEMFIGLHPQECIVRLFDGREFLLTMKVKTVDINRWK